MERDEAGRPLPVSGPSARTFVKMVYDQRRRKLVLFGGYDATGFVNDTWELGSDLDIVTEPGSFSVVPGAPAQLHVVATGTRPLSYQWMKDGSPLVDGGSISGSTTDTLVIDPAQTADTGAYSVVISDACGPVDSRKAALLVAVVPGRGGAGEMRASYDRATGTIAVTYTPACAASDHTIHYGASRRLAVLQLLRIGVQPGDIRVGVLQPGHGQLLLPDRRERRKPWKAPTGSMERASNVPQTTNPSACTLPQNPNSTCD